MISVDKIRFVCDELKLNIGDRIANNNRQEGYNNALLSVKGDLSNYQSLGDALKSIFDGRDYYNSLAQEADADDRSYYNGMVDAYTDILECLD